MATERSDRQDGDSFLRVEGRGIDGPPPASASLHGLRPQTVLRRTIDPSPYLRSLEPNTARPGLGGAFAQWWVGGLLGFP